MLNKDMKKNDKYKKLNLTAVRQVEKLLSELKPNSDSLLIGLPSATLV
jgi:hypothetical protein